MSVFTDLKNELLDIIKHSSNEATSAYDTQATVVRTDEDTIWVHIPGGVAETPVRKTVDAKEGDEIQIRVGGGRAWAVGNATAPPTDDRTAVVAQNTANEASQVADKAREMAESAEQAATTAWNYADSAHEAADTAWNHANSAYSAAVRANTSANDALIQLSTVEDVVDTLNWVTEHGTMTKTTDTAIDPTHVYFVRDNNGDYVVGSNHYRIVTEPKAEELSTYYVLSIDEAVSNYVTSHLALTNEGLYVVKDNQGYKVLLANDGLKIYDNQGHLVSTFGESITFDSSRPQRIGNDSTYIKWYDSNNDQVPDSIEISGSNVSIADSVTIGGMPTKVSDLTNDSGYQTSGQVSSAISTATSGLATKGNAIKATVSVYYRKTTSGAPSKPTASTTIGTSASTDNAWEYVMPQPKKGCYFYTCERYTFADDNVAFSAVRSIDNATYTSKWCNETDNTYIDGGAIYANSVTAEQIAAHSITVGKMDEDAQSQVLNSNIQIGGRNLLLDTNAPSLTKVASEANRYWSSNSTLASDGTATFVSISDPPSKGITYGIKLDCTTSGTRWHGLAFYNTPNTAKMTFEAGKTYTQSVYIRVASGTANQCQITSQDQTSYGVTAYLFTPTAEWQRYSRTFTPTSTGTQKVVYFEMRYQNIGSVEMCGFQIEEGNKATTWTPAPEDVDADISDAAKTATNYITADSSGIKVHASGTSGTDYVGITSNSLKMYSGGNELVTMNSTGALVLGLAAGNHVQLTGTGMHLAGKNSAGTATVNRMTLSSSGITMRNDSGTVTATIGDTITLGTVAANKYNTLIDSTGMKVRKNTTVLASFGTTMIIGDHSGGNILDGTRFQVTNTGANVQRWLDESEDYQTLWNVAYYNTGSMYPGADMSIGGAYIRGTSDIEGATLEIKATKQISLGLGSADISPLIYINGRQYGANYDLWSGGLYMSAGHTTGDHFNNNLTITDQPNGVVLAWSAYASGAKDYDWVYYFIPKRHVQLYNGTGVGIPLCTQTTSGTITWACKYVKVYDNKIVGTDGNNKGNNAKWVLRRVIGV